MWKRVMTVGYRSEQEICLVLHWKHMLIRYRNFAECIEIRSSCQFCCCWTRTKHFVLVVLSSALYISLSPTPILNRDIRCSFHHSHNATQKVHFPSDIAVFCLCAFTIIHIVLFICVFYIHYHLSVSFMMGATSKVNLGWIFNSINRFKLLFQY